MKIIPLAIPDVLLITPVVHSDERGYFMESYRQDFLERASGYHVKFMQDNESSSRRGVLRGLHYQLPPFSQSKLVRVIEGEVLDVAVDVRVGSPTFGQHVSAHLSADNKQQLFIPRGFAHGFVVLSEKAIFTYKVDNPYAPELDAGIHFADSALGIDWQLPAGDIITSAKDASLPTLAERLEQQPETLFNYDQALYG